jgi:FkbM family methyltransferase
MNYGPSSDFHTSGENEVIKYIKGLYNHNEKIVVFDVGANLGGYTNMVLDCLGSQAYVHAFEPSASTFEMLQKNIDGSRVKANNIGCSDAPRTMSMYSNKKGSGIASVYNRKLDFCGISMKEVEQSKFVRIDDYCQENNVGHIHLLKLDIEGHELFALKGAQGMIDNNNIDFIQFEFGGCNIDSRTFFQDFYYFLHDKYDIYRILQKGLYKIDQYSEYLEIYVTVNYLAKLQ